MTATQEQTYTLNPFEELPRLVAELAEVFSAIRSCDPLAEDKVRRLQITLEELCQFAPEATLAAIHLSKEKSPLKQAVFSALIAELLCQKMGYTDKQRRMLISAILTANISFLEFQVLLNTMDAPLNDHQLSKIKRHPQESAELLKAAGIKDELWLKIVEQHHEKVDGSGYPYGLKGDEIIEDAIIVAICEFYTAMIDNRAYRTPKKAKVAMSEMYERGLPEEKAIHVNFIKTLGVYPPGTYVTLANNEVAIVHSRNPNSPNPIVKALFDPTGEPYMGGLTRDTSKSEFKVKSATIVEKRPSVDLAALWAPSNSN